MIHKGVEREGLFDEAAASLHVAPSNNNNNNGGGGGGCGGGSPPAAVAAAAEPPSPITASSSTAASAATAPAPQVRGGAKERRVKGARTRGGTREARCVAETVWMKERKSYIKRHNLHGLLGSVMDQCLCRPDEELPEHPALFLAENILRSFLQDAQSAAAREQLKQSGPAVRAIQGIANALTGLLASLGTPALHPSIDAKRSPGFAAAAAPCSPPDVDAGSPAAAAPAGEAAAPAEAVAHVPAPTPAPAPPAAPAPVAAEDASPVEAEAEAEAEAAPAASLSPKEEEDAVNRGFSPLQQQQQPQQQASILPPIVPPAPTLSESPAGLDLDADAAGPTPAAAAAADTSADATFAADIADTLPDADATAATAPAPDAGGTAAATAATTATTTTTDAAADCSAVAADGGATSADADADADATTATATVTAATVATSPATLAPQPQQAEEAEGPAAAAAGLPSSSPAPAPMPPQAEDERGRPSAGGAAKPPLALSIDVNPEKDMCPPVDAFDALNTPKMRPALGSMRNMSCDDVRRPNGGGGGGTRDSADGSALESSQHSSASSTSNRDADGGSGGGGGSMRKKKKRTGSVPVATSVGRGQQQRGEASEWEEVLDKETGRVFWFNKRREERTDEKPREVSAHESVSSAADWCQVPGGENGSVWYFNTRTGMKQWHKPEALKETLPRGIGRGSRLSSLVSSSPSQDESGGSGGPGEVRPRLSSASRKDKRPPSGASTPTAKASREPRHKKIEVAGGWTMYQQEGGPSYFIDETGGTKQWAKPPEIEDELLAGTGWQEYDYQGVPYYVNKKAGVCDVCVGGGWE